MIGIFYASVLAVPVIQNPPTIWLGGVPIPTSDLPQDVPTEVFNSLSGCLFHVSYIYGYTPTLSAAPFLLTAEDSVANI